MRKLSKRPKPKILVDNAAAWTKEYCDCINSGEKPSSDLANKYNHSTIKSELEKETHGKCAYCESKIKHISFGDIEHILPKNKDARPDLYVEWDNLTIACAQCNRSGKGSYYDPALLLINPYLDEPEEHFQGIGSLVMPLLSDDRATITEKIIKLNRPALVEQRLERIKSIEVLLQTWESEQNQTMKDLIKKELYEECAIDKEYSFVIKAFLAMRGFSIDGIA